MQDAAVPAARSMARTLLDDADAAALRLQGTPAVATGRATLALAVIVCAGVTLTLTGGTRSVAMAFMLTVVLALVALVIVTRSTRTVLPNGWTRRLAISSFLIYIAIFILNTRSVWFGDLSGLPLWAAVSIAVLVALPLAACGLWLIRRRVQPSASRIPATANPFIVLAALAAVDAVGLRSLRSATGLPAGVLDRILTDFDERELVDVGWGGTGPGRNTPIALTRAGRAAYADLRARLSLDAEGQGDA